MIGILVAISGPPVGPFPTGDDEGQMPPEFLWCVLTLLVVFTLILIAVVVSEIVGRHKK